MNPLVSIVIPAHNAASWLAATIESALAQTWAPLEIIVINDGSTDNSLAVARNFAARGVRVVDQANAGAAAARNHGLRLAQGEYIQFLDADDLINPDKISLQMSRLRAAPPRYLASGEWARFLREPIEARFTPEPNWRDLTGLEFQRLHYAEGWMMQPAAWLCPRTLLDAAGPWDESLSLNDDGEYFNRVMLASEGILFCPGARTYYRSGIHTSLSRRSDRKALQSLWDSTRLNCERLLAAAGNDAEMRRALATGWQRLAFELYPSMPELALAAEERMKSLGGPAHPLPGGRIFQVLTQLLGWRLAKRLRDQLS